LVNRKEITRRRQALGITKLGLSERIYCSESVISQIERGFRQPSLSVMERVANALGCKIDDLVISVEDAEADEMKQHDRTGDSLMH
jgi:transcriptional regulator with XRE-family HTH domain